MQGMHAYIAPEAIEAIFGRRRTRPEQLMLM